MLSNTKKSKVLRMRGGAGGNMNVDSKFNEIPYLSKMNFMWNRLPCLDFGEKGRPLRRRDGPDDDDGRSRSHFPEGETERG